MPQILVVADSPEETPGAIVYRERIACSDLESDHFSGQLVERVNWAVQDADRLERASKDAGPKLEDWLASRSRPRGDRRPLGSVAQ